MHHRKLEWKVRKTEHLDIYFYEGEDSLSMIAAQIAEEAYIDLERDLQYSPESRLPVIIYSSHNIFQETNTIPYILPEGVGGFTEYFMGRVVMPFNGSYRDFYHTLKHELVHSFQIRQLTHDFDAHGLFYLYMYPLWLSEGFAEFYSEGGGHEMESVIRSAILEGDFYPISRIYPIYGTYVMYKEAESFLLFLEDEFGRGTVREIARRWWQKAPADEILRQVTGKSLEQLDHMWKKHLMDVYYPLITEGNLPEFYDNMLTEGNGYFLSPAVKKGDSSYTIYSKGNTMGYGGLYKLEKKSPLSQYYKPKLLLKSNLSENALSIHPFHNRISISGDTLVMSVRKSKGDALTLFDLKKEKIIEQILFEEIPSISSPMVSSNKIVFSGADIEGFVDLYLYDIQTGALEQLTNDTYDDEDAIFLGDTAIVFSSDRCMGGDKELRYGLYIMNISTKEFSQIKLPDGIHRNPRLSPDSKTLVFSSNMGGQFQNIWAYDFHTSQYYRLTNFLTQVLEPAFATNDTIIATAYNEMGFHLAKFAIPDFEEDVGLRYGRLDTAIIVPDSLEPGKAEIKKVPEISWKPTGLDADAYKTGIASYGSRMQFEIAQGAMATSNNLESSGGLEGLFSDMLGDKQLYFMVYTPGEIDSDFFRNFNLFVNYSNHKQRPGWGFGGYHLFHEAYNRYDSYYTDERSGITANLTMPFSRYARAESNMYAYYYKRNYSIYTEDIKEGGAISLNGSLIRDTAIWGITGPVEGMRANLTAGMTIDPKNADYLSYILSLDARHYLRILKRLTWANRAIARCSDGEFPERFYMGGTWTFRGYPFFYFYGRNQVLLNSELRFPLVDIVAVRTPLIDFDIRGVQSALFFDAGESWEEPEDYNGLLGSYGLSFRVSLGGYTALRFDFAKRTDFNTFDDNWCFDFFFGWDY
ncbi:MAG: hypothetical protein ACLFSQ_02895 [Candidatus Zixiibacteriota bacterium]